MKWVAQIFMHTFQIQIVPVFMFNFTGNITYYKLEELYQVLNMLYFI